MSVLDKYLENKPMPASVRTDNIIMPAAPQPVNPISSFPILQREKVIQITKINPKKIKIEGGKNNPNIVKFNIIIA